MLLSWCVVVSVLLGGAATARAGSGGVVTLPLPGIKMKSGLALQVDSSWVDGTGYRPLRIRVSSIPPRPAPADRSIEVTLRPRSWSMSSVRTAVTQTIELPQGAMFSDATLAIPYYETFDNFDIETREDGNLLPDLSVARFGWPGRVQGQWSEAIPTILVLERDAPSKLFSSRLPAKNARLDLLPDIRALASRLPQLNYNGTLTGNSFDTSKAVDDSDITRLLLDIPRLEILPPEDLPERWIELSCIGIMIVSFDELERIVREMPATWQAIRDWQASGATLCVYGLGTEYQRLADLERHLVATPLAVDDRQPHLRGWREPNRKDYTDEVHALSGRRGNAAYFNQTTAESAEDVGPRHNEGDPPDPQLFVLRDVRQGEVVAVRADNPFPGETADWAWLLNSLAPDGWMWYRRHGMSLHRENVEYWALLIPGVGKAPVNSFLVLISLFVVMIGPVNYFFLQRQRRLYLILATVPLGACIVTASLLIFALLTDGLGVRMRTRSVTEIDQPSGQVVAWSRQSYYAGLAPSAGLSFPRDAAVYPVEYRPLAGKARRDSRNQIIWGEDQRLASGFLTTRSTKQFLVVESRQTTLGLTVDETVDPPRLTNRLGVAIDQVILRTTTGKLFAAARLGSAATADMSPIEATHAETQWNALMVANRPKYPQGFNALQLENVGDFFSDYDYSREVDQTLSAPTFQSSIFERRLRELMALRFRGLEPRSYLAAVAQPVEVSVGVEGAREEAGFHLVTGRW